MKPNEQLINLFLQFQKLNKQDAPFFILENPLLLAISEWQAIENEISKMKEEDKEIATRYYTSLRSVYQYFYKNPTKFPFSDTPLGRIWVRYSNGEIKFEHALELAANPKIANQLSILMVEIVIGRAETISNNGDWRTGLQLGKLLLSAIDGRTYKFDQLELKKISVKSWIVIVIIGLINVPDGRLLSDTSTRAKELISLLSVETEAVYLGQLYQNLGALHLDTYTNGRTSINYMAQYNTWLGRVEEEFGLNIKTLEGDAIKIPEPKESFSMAADYFLKAAELSEGLDEARALKGHAEALCWSDIVGADVDKEEIILLAEKAIKRLSPEQFPNEYATLINICHLYQKDIDNSTSKDFQALIKKNPLDYAKEHGIENAISTYYQVIPSIKSSNPDKVLELYGKMWPLIFNSGRDEHINHHAQVELKAFTTAVGKIQFERKRDKSLIEIYNSVLARGKEENSTKKQMAASLIGLSSWGATIDKEDESLTILNHALEIFPEIVNTYLYPIGILKFNLFLGMAVNAINNDNIELAINKYCSGCEVVISLKLSSYCLEILRKIEDIVPRCNEKGLYSLISWLFKYSISIDRTCGYRGREVLRRTTSRMMATLARNGIVNPVGILFFYQIAKGVNFSASLLKESTYNLGEDPEAHSILDQIEKIEHTVSNIDKPNADEYIDDYFLLSSYSGPGSQDAGSSETEVLNNLYRKFDELVERKRLENLPNQNLQYATPEMIQQILDDKTIVLNYFLGQGPEGETAIYILTITKEDIRFTIGKGSFPDAQITLSEKGRTAAMDPFAILIADLIGTLSNEDPYPLDISEKGASILKKMENYLFGGPIKEELKSDKNNGKDHLVIIPHGAFHFFPFHLMSANEELLAENWSINYLPNLSLIWQKRQSDEIGNKKLFAAFGIDFVTKNPHGLTPIENAPIEAKELAELFNVNAITNEDATESAFVQALRESRYLHIATHGKQRVIAPMFHKIYLMPDEHNDGIINAYEILGLDLSHLELLTLGACETALGRIDIADNLKGLPAAFLSCGVSNIIGTLWEVEANASEHFFKCLYENINLGIQYRYAFQKAQMDTKKHFSNYRDWGAFYMIGMGTMAKDKST